MASLVHAACGSCGEQARPSSAPLEATEQTTLPALPEATNPFSKTSRGPDLVPSALRLPVKTPLLFRMASPDRFDEILEGFEAERRQLGFPDSGWRATSVLAKILNFDPSEWVAQDKPATLFFLDPSRYILGEVLVLGIRDTDALLKQLPKGTFDEDEAPPEGHTAVYRTRTGNIYVDFLGPNVVFTKHDAVFGKVKDFIAKDLASWERKHDLDIVIDVIQLRDAFSKEIALTREDPTPRGKRGSGVPLLSKRALLNLADGFDQLSAQIDFQDAHFKVSASALQREDPRGESASLVKWLGALSGRTGVPLRGLPQGVWAASSISADLSDDGLKPFWEGLSLELNGLYGEVLDLTPAEREASGPLWARLLELLSGGGYAFAFEQGEVPACGALVLEVSDANRARFLVKRLLETFLLRIVPRIQDEEIEIADMPFPDGDFRSTAELFKALNEVYQQVGVSFYESSLVEAGEDIAGEALGVRFDTQKREEAAKAGKATLGDVLGSQLEVALAYRGNLLSLVMSPNASNQAALLVSGSFGEGGGPFRDIGPGEAAVMAFALDRLVVAVPKLWPNATSYTTPDTLRGDASLALKTSDRAFTFELSLPAKSIALLEALKGDKDERSSGKTQKKSDP